MREDALLKVFAGLALCAAGSLACADTVIDNARGYSFNIDRQLVQFQAIAFNDAGKVTAIGSMSEVAAKAPGARHIDIAGKTLLPGMIDAHGHIFSLGMSAIELDLQSSQSLADAQRKLASYAGTHAGSSWIRGFGWNQAVWKLGRFPTAQELDTVVADRPVWLSRVDGHAGWANSRALQLAGISKATPDPVGGRIERDDYGNPSGVLVDKAMALLDKVVPAYTDAENRSALEAALARMRQVGLTSVHDAGVSAQADKLFREYADQDKLTTRVYGMISGVGDFFDRVSAAGPLASYAQDKYALRAVKLFADGALGSRGAALLEPYQDAPDSHGLLFKTDAEITAMMEKAIKKGYQVNVHAIGDAGNRQILDAYEKLNRQYGTAHMRHRIEHAQVVALSDIPRFKQLDILPSMQPTHATSDMNMAEARIGRERIKGAYAWRSFLQQGSIIPCGSDFPVESPNPFWGIHAAVTRQDMHDMPAGGWHADQAMTVTEAFRCFTIDAAYAAHQETVLGTLEPGKWADFIIIDQDLFSMPVQDIYKIEVLQTWLAGNRAYSK